MTGNDAPASADPPAPRAERKRMSAFAEMMAAQAKRQKLERAGCRHDASDAFAEMMAAARERGAFDGPPAAASATASDGDSSGDRDGWRDFPAGETDPAVRAELERFDLCARHSDDECWSDDEDDLDDDDDDSGSKASDLPEPQKDPSPGSSLKEIIVHTGRSYRGNIMGFTFVHSDDTVVSTGKIRGTNETKLISFEKGCLNDHIVAIKPSYKWHRPKFLKALKLVTKKGREVTFPQDGHGFSDENVLRVGEGHELKSIKWDDFNQQITGLETVEQPPIAKKEDKPFSISSCPIPPLSILARKAIESNSVAKSRSVEKNAKLAMKRSRQITDLECKKIYAEAKRDLRRSAEAERVRALRAELDAAEDKLKCRATAVLDSAHRKFRSVAWNQRCQRDDVRSRLRASRAGIRTDLETFRDTLESNYQLSSDAAAICTSPDCRKFFDWTKVQTSRRCAAPGCSRRHPSCGCNVATCRRCNDSFCERHAKRHERVCAVEAKTKCGWNEEDKRVLPIMCGRVLGEDDLKRKCWYCEAACCSECYEMCSGYSPYGQVCGKIWCKQCLERCSGVGEACCDNCSFHGDLWVSGWD